MLGILVFLAACSPLSMAMCSVNQTAGGTCTNPEDSRCTSECSRRRFNSTCLDFPGCDWDGTQCRPVDATLHAECQNQSLSADCANITGCYWERIVCKYVQVCESTNITNPISCAGAQNATSCAARGSHCAMTSACWDDMACILHDDQASCSAEAGCFWLDYTLTTSQNFATDYVGVCKNCFPWLDVNLYAFVRDSLVGQSCNSTTTTFNDYDSGSGSSSSSRITNYLRAVPAATGCTGGLAVQIPRALFVGDATCTPTVTTPPTTIISENNSSSTSSGSGMFSAFAVFSSLVVPVLLLLV